MAPSPKAVKSDVSLKVYNLTRDVRRCLDTADRSFDTVKVTHLNEALSEARKLVQYLTLTVENKLSLAGNGGRLYDERGNVRD